MDKIKLENVIITSRSKDGYINATQLCKAGQRKFDTYYRQKKTKEFLKIFSEEAQICVSTLINIEQTTNINKCSWVHPQVAINIAQWISAEFDVKVSKWVHELLLFGNVTLNNERSYKELEEKLK